ncbi:hypothetical protein ABZ990_07375 [Streptomyces sp. NPDC046203]|uniref:hypothetical protein n=1 Tax=Streptomyces sp. NPDC046203 TaxID=3154602 RepID=UPI003409917A
MRPWHRRQKQASTHAWFADGHLFPCRPTGPETDRGLLTSVNTPKVYGLYERDLGTLADLRFE